MRCCYGLLTLVSAVCRHMIGSRPAKGCDTACCEARDDLRYSYAHVLKASSLLLI